MWAWALAGYLVVLGFTWWLRWLNVRHLRSRGRSVPPELAGVVDGDTLARISSYTVNKSRLALVQSAVNGALVLAFFFGGLLGVYDRWISGLTDSFVGGGVLFCSGLLLAEVAVGIPFGIYGNFRLEARYGFNARTARLWLSDLLKSVAISVALLAVAVSAALWLVQLTPRWWWLSAWAFFLLFSVFLMYVSPYVIEPLFFRFEPLAVAGLEDRIRELMGRAGVRVSRVYQVDASRRSRHSNAYFTGLGRVKRIVVFDTLVRLLAPEEILAVLAHEAAHWKKRHVLKRLVVTEACALGAAWVAFRLIRWEGLPGLTGLEEASFYARALIVLFLGSLCLFPLTPLLAALSRRQEWQADRLASNLTGRPGTLADALAKLARDNLSNLHPHPFYAWFHFTHPTVTERIRSLRPTPD